MKKLLIRGGVMVLFFVIVYGLGLMYPSLFYKHIYQHRQVSLHSNADHVPNASNIIDSAIFIIEKCPLYTKDIQIDLCLNDDKVYPNLHPFSGGIAYSFANKSVFFWAHPDFTTNTARYVNQERDTTYVDLSWLIAHEFIHNLQYHEDLLFPTKLEFWQQEGYAEYYSRQWQNDGNLCERLVQLQSQDFRPELNDQIELKDGTIQNAYYFKYATLMQYLIEIKGLTFQSLLDYEGTEEEVINEIASYCL